MERGDSILEIFVFECIDGVLTGVEFFRRVGKEEGLERMNSSQEEQLGAEAIHGLSEKILEGSPPMSVVMPELMAFLGNTPVVAFNAGFDVTMIEVEARQLNIPFRITKWVDLMGPSLTYFRQFTSQTFMGLKYACTQLGVPREDRKAHSARYDANLHYQVWKALEKLGGPVPLNNGDSNGFVTKVRGPP